MSSGPCHHRGGDAKSLNIMVLRLNEGSREQRENSEDMIYLSLVPMYVANVTESVTLSLRAASVMEFCKSKGTYLTEGT